jgi:Peptidase A4 family
MTYHPRGAVMPVITLAGGLKVTTYEPPRELDPMTADARDLQRFGLPPRPDDPRHRDRYDQVAGRLKGKLNYITPTFRRNEEKYHGPRQRLPEAATETSTNWSGGVVFAPTGQSFSWVEGDWVIPDVDAPTDGTWYYCSNWIGLDGDGSGDVCQIGIECDVFRSGSSVTKDFYAWWEWFPLFEVQITNFPVSPGDMITALLCTGGAGSTEAFAFLTNRTTGDSTSFSFDAPSGTSLMGNSAEWVVEAPTVNGQQSSLADYGEVFFSVCETMLGTIGTGGTTVDGGTGDDINMIDGSGSLVSDGRLITPTIIQCEYVGALP